MRRKPSGDTGFLLFKLEPAFLKTAGPFCGCPYHEIPIIWDLHKALDFLKLPLEAYDAIPRLFEMLDHNSVGIVLEAPKLFVGQWAF